MNDRSTQFESFDSHGENCEDAVAYGPVQASGGAGSTSSSTSPLSRDLPSPMLASPDPRSDAAMSDAAMSPSSILDGDKSDFCLVHPSYVVVERFGGFIFALVLLLTGMVGCPVYWFWYGWDFICAIGGSVCLGLVLLVVLSSCLIPPLSYRHLRWRLTDSGLEIQSGIWWRVRMAVPVARVQHADVSQGPLQRYFGLSTLTVYTAGKDHASVKLEGLAYDIAISLRDQVVRQHEARDVV